MKTFGDYINETYIIKVHSNATKTKKLSCPPGYKPNEAGTACVPMSSQEKHNLKVGAKEAKITKKAEGQAMLNKANKKRKKALKFRKMFGVKNPT